MTWADTFGFPFYDVPLAVVGGFLVLGFLAAGVRYLVTFVRSILGDFW